MSVTSQFLQESLLKRYPPTKDVNLRAWNAADEYIIEHSKSEPDLQAQLKNSTQCLIINDQFGALTTAFAHLDVNVWTDSYLSSIAIKNNCDRLLEKDSQPQFLCFDSLTTKSLVIDSSFQASNQFGDNITKLAPKPFDLVLIRVPKHLSLLAFQLEQIKPHIHADTKIIAGGMTKEIHNNTLKLFESLIGTTKTSLAKKKSRLIFGQPNLADATVGKKNAQITSYTIKNPISNTDSLNIQSYPGVFSRDSLDQGTQVLFEYLPNIKINSKVVDLGCGAGVIGAVIAQAIPSTHLIMTDESALAIKSAQLTFQKNQLQNSKFIQTDVLDNVTESNFDYVFCNPPFHQQNVQTLSIANKMFRQSSLKLKPTGQLFVVANRHLKYGEQLKRYFNQVKSISNHAKFTIWQAEKPKAGQSA